MLRDARFWSRPRSAGNGARASRDRRRARPHAHQPRDADLGALRRTAGRLSPLRCGGGRSWLPRLAGRVLGARRDRDAAARDGPHGGAGGDGDRRAWSRGCRCEHRVERALIGLLSGRTSSTHEPSGDPRRNRWADDARRDRSVVGRGLVANDRRGRRCAVGAACSRLRVGTADGHGPPEGGPHESERGPHESRAKTLAPVGDSPLRRAAWFRVARSRAAARRWERGGPRRMDLDLRAGRGIQRVSGDMGAGVTLARPDRGARAAVAARRTGEDRGDRDAPRLPAPGASRSSSSFGRRAGSPSARL